MFKRSQLSVLVSATLASSMLYANTQAVSEADPEQLMVVSAERANYKATTNTGSMRVEMTQLETPGQVTVINEQLIEERISAVLSDDLKQYSSQNLVCVAGSMTSLGAMFKGLSEYDDENVNGAQIQFDEFNHFVSDISILDQKEISKRYPFLGKRAKTIVGGAIVAQIIAEFLGVTTLEVSTSGLRYGTILSGVIDGKYIN